MDTVSLLDILGMQLYRLKSLLLALLFEDRTLVQHLTGLLWIKVIVIVVEDLGSSTQSILLDSLEQTCVLVSRTWGLFRWRPFCGSASSVFSLIVCG